MTNTWPYEKRILEEFRASRGNICEAPECQETDRLEIHHAVQGNVFGRERGAARAYEIKAHPDWFKLFCKRHHAEAHPGGFRNFTVQDQVDEMEEQLLRQHPEVLAWTS